MKLHNFYITQVLVKFQKISLFIIAQKYSNDIGNRCWWAILLFFLGKNNNKHWLYNTHCILIALHVNSINNLPR